MPVSAKAWFVYLARCKDGTLYTGIARNVAERIALHNAGKGARYTRGRGPVVVCAVRRCRSKGDALRLEYAVKQLPRADKERLAKARRFVVRVIGVDASVRRKKARPRPSRQA